MFCHIAQRNYSEFAGHVEEEARRLRIPYMGALELTYRCNLSCRHCYCNLAVGDKSKSEEMSIDEIKKILDEASDAGCLWLLLTGGEILLRKDFSQVYLYATKKGMLVEVFTNATLIDENIARLFEQFPPVGIDISIYGATPSVHDRITGTKGSFERTVAGMKLLKKHGVKFSMKTMLMTLNYSDLKNIRELSKDLGAEHSYDASLCSRLDGGTAPAAYRLGADEMARLDLELDFNACDWMFTNFWNKKCDEAPVCGGGVFAFNIDPYGILSPCTMFTSFQYSLREESFKDAWKRLVDDCYARRKEFTPPECLSCSMILICSQCAAAAELEVKSPNKTVAYICEYIKCLEKKFFEKKKEAEDAKKSV